MNILVIPTWYPSGKDKLMGIYHKEFCEALAKCPDINVNMLYVDRQRLSAPLKYLFMKKKEIIEEKGYKTYIEKMLDVRKINYDFQLKRYVKTLEKLFLEYLKTNPKPDCLHAHVMMPAGYAATKIGEKYNIPVLITEHAHAKRFFAGRYKNYSEYAYKHSKLTTVSKFMASELKEINKECDCLPNLVDTEVFKKKRTKIKDLNIVTLSALREGKRIDDVIEALKIIIEKEKNIKAKLTVIGDGFLEEYYKKRCLELGMDDYVTFVGRKTKEEAADILNKNNILVIASEFETFAIPGLEALASGMPVVATKCHGPEEYIDKKCGKLVSVGNTKEMADAILEVYHNIDKYDIEYLRSIADKYNAKSITDKAIKLYKELLKNN